MISTMFTAAVICSAMLSSTPPAAVGPLGPVTGISYEVTYDAATARNRIIHVRMSFRAPQAGAVTLSFPAWTPGSYELDNYARHVRDFSAAGTAGAIRWDKTDYDTWRVFPEAAGPVTVAFDYRADTLDVGSSWSAPDFVFFNGTNLLPFPEGQGLDFPARLSIHTEPDWSVVTGLTTTGEGDEYSAASYHELVDHPTFIGRFDLDSQRIGDAWYRLATYPAGAMDGRPRKMMQDQLKRMMPVMSRVFGETPWSDYTVMMVFDPSVPGGSALEHANSHLGTYANQFIGSPVLASVVAHEIFHAWNVKRLRPADMWPYAYDHPQPTPLLWISEGITDYYADLALVRSGIVPAPTFYQLTAGKIGNVRTSPPVALEDASLSTWIEPDDGTAFLYYPKGSLAGLALDILIRDASDNRHSLDGVLRELYQKAYKAGHGFTNADWWEVVSTAAAGRTFDDFYTRYIDGRGPWPWAEFLPLAGLELRADTVRAPQMGIRTTPGDSAGLRVTDVTPGSSADEGGIQAGDILVRVGTDQVDATFGLRFRQHFRDATDGTPFDVVVRRNGQPVTLTLHLRFSENVSYRIRPAADASDKAVRIRDGILKGTTTP